MSFQALTSTHKSLSQALNVLDWVEACTLRQGKCLGQVPGRNACHRMVVQQRGLDKKAVEAGNEPHNPVQGSHC